MTFRKNTLSLSCLVCVALTLGGNVVFADIPLPKINTNNVINVTNAAYGAVGDGMVTNTTAIQNAINAAALGGVTNGLSGGTVEIPAGGFLCGPLTMKSYVNLQIDTGATLKMLPYGSYPGGTSPTDFISASKLHDIEISGPGTIDGQGAAWWAAYEAGGISRPKAMFAPSTCTNVLVQNITMQSPPNTHISLRSVCKNVTVQGIIINTTSDVLSDNTDGIDVNATNCLIQNCFISCGDDHVAMGGGSSAITITNCTFGNGHGVSIGSHTDGGLQNLLVNSNTMTIYDSASLSSGIRMKSGRDRGGFVRNLTYINMALTNVQNPIFISSYYPDSTIPANPTTDTGSAVTATTPIWRDITISNVNIVAYSGRNAGRIYGLPEMLITNLTLSKVTVKGDLSFVMYHIRNAQCIDSQINVPASVNTFNLYNVDLTLTNSVFNTNLVKIAGGSSALITNRLTFFNARVVFTDTNVLPRTASVTLGGSTLTVSNNWNMDASQVLNFTLGASNATIAVVSNLTLNGTINISAGDGFTNGTYTIFTYGNTLAWGTPVLGNVPAGYLCSFDTNTVGQVKLVAQLPVPPTPTNVIASPTNLLVQLSWSASATATSYNVKRSTTNGGPYSVIAPGLASTNYNDASVTSGTTYYYVVSAVNSGGEGTNSAPVSAVPNPSLALVTLSTQMVSNQLCLSWPADHTGWRLQIQTNNVTVGLSSNWANAPDSATTNQVFLSIDSMNGSVFLRLAYP